MIIGYARVSTDAYPADFFGAKAKIDFFGASAGASSAVSSDASAAASASSRAVSSAGVSWSETPGSDSSALSAAFAGFSGAVFVAAAKRRGERGERCHGYTPTAAALWADGPEAPNQVKFKAATSRVDGWIEWIGNHD